MKDFMYSKIVMALAVLASHTTIQAQNVGIGTNNPSAKLHIVDNSNAVNKLIVQSDNTSVLSAISMQSTIRNGSISFGYVTNNNVYGNPGETYIYSSTNMQGLNIINQNTAGNGHIAFYAGRNHSSTATLFVADNQNIGFGTQVPSQRLHVIGNGRFSALAGAGTRMVTTDANGVLGSQAITTGDITQVNAGNGLIGGGTAGNVTLNAAADNGLNINADRIRLGGDLLQTTLVNLKAFPLRFNLDGTGDFDIQIAGTNKFSVVDNNTILTGSDVFFRDGSTIGTNLVVIEGDGNDGRLRVMENGAVSIDLDANTQSVFNEQGLNRDFRVESDGNQNMLRVDASTNRLGVGVGSPSQTLHVQGGGRITSLSGTGNRMVTADANGVLNTQAITTGDITQVNAGNGLSGGGTAGNVTVNANADNGLNINADRIRLGGPLVQATTIGLGANPLQFNLDGTGDFDIQDNGVNVFAVIDNGNIINGNDVYFRDGNTLGTNLAILSDDGNDGRFRIMENGATSVDLDANTQFVFNEQGFNRDFRVESDNNANMFRLDASTNRVGIGTGVPSQTLHVQGGGRITSLSGAGNRMVIADANGVLNTQAITVGDITSVTAGNGLSGGGNAGNLTVNANADNGLNINSDRIRLGGDLVQATTINAKNHPIKLNLDGSGNFDIQNNGVNKFAVVSFDKIFAGSDMIFRDGSTVGTNLAVIESDGGDGRVRVMENGIVSIDLDANTHSVFNEQGLNRDFRIESDGNQHMFFADASSNRVSIGTNATAGTFNVQGTSYHSDDIYLRDGAVNTGDVLVRIWDSSDDGVIDVYQNNAINHRIYGNGATVFNEQGLANGDFRIESDTRTHAFWADANENIVRFGTNSTTSDYQDGNTVAGVVVDYVADFDRGVGSSGTAIGIGSVEYLLDNVNETNINNSFSPTTHINRDLGFSTTARGWDDVYADNFVNISDAREKNNIQNLTYGLAEILQMRPVSYTLKKDPWAETKLGLIAQEALVLVPEAVKTHDHKQLDESKPEEFTKVEMERMGMTYQQLIPVLIKATQEQQAQIEALKAEIQAMKEAKK